MATLPPHAQKGNSYIVYCLIDPRNYTIRYIGITDNVYARFIQHLRCDGSNQGKDAWIAELKAENVMLIMKTLETVETVEQARERETFWIHHHRFIGSPILNLQIPSIGNVPRQVIQPPLPRIGNSGSKYGRKSNYQEVREVVIHRYRHGVLPDGLSADMREHFEFYYFVRPKRTEATNPKKYAQHKKSYERGRKWIAELFEGDTSASEAV